jgi:hypothetical protein
MSMERTLNSREHFLELEMNWEDFDLLNQGKQVETRWPMGKVYAHNMDPLSKGNHKKMDRSMRKREGAVLNLETGDVNIYVPSGVLNTAFYLATNFSYELGNLRIEPYDERSRPIHIRLIFPR